MKFEMDKMTDVHKLVISYVIALVVFQIVFFMENILTTIRTVSVLFWLFVLPGIGITYLWKLNFVERFALSVAISSALMGISSYYLGLVGVHVNMSSIFLPVVFMVIGFLVIFRNGISKKVRA